MINNDFLTLKDNDFEVLKDEVKRIKKTIIKNKKRKKYRFYYSKRWKISRGNGNNRKKL